MTFEAIKQSVMKFIEDEEGLTVVEYAIAGGLVALGVTGAFTMLGDGVEITIDKLSNCLGQTSGQTCPN
ncbi:Flp family type IVb pilin [Metapseudomonas boanensis]|uniref:Flp family type IVb pilin n=1 Tax=Metapseudomonas boanensis TaxID=2822138 RepID=A0ABS5XH43_9GAMM|nr:Flp family type IVb pilin [Pseudomonas boanensis]MBT8766355.1 Flp family type IVb pilin [Pseudomonas boanensis]